MTSETKIISGIPVKLYSQGAPTRAVLAVHGFGGSRESLAIAGLVERLCPEGYLIAAPDLPVMGSAPSRNQNSPRSAVLQISAQSSAGWAGASRISQRLPPASAGAVSCGLSKPPATRSGK